MSDAVLIALISSLATVVVAAVGGILGVPIYRNSKRIRHQVENSHKTNLREESDERHVENSTSLGWIVKALTWMVPTLQTLVTDVTMIKLDLGLQDGRLEELEKTYDPHRKETE